MQKLVQFMHVIYIPIVGENIFSFEQEQHYSTHDPSRHLWSM